MWYTKADVEKKLEEVRHGIEKVEFLAKAFALEGKPDKAIELLELRLEYEGIKAKLEFLIRENLVD